MTRPRALSLWLVAAVVAMLVGGAIAAGAVSGAGFRPVAYSINGHQVAQQTVDDELASLAAHEKLSAQLFGSGVKSTAGAVSSSVAATWVNVRIQIEIFRGLLRSNHASVTAADRAAVRSQLPPGKEFDHLSAGTRQVIVDNLSAVNVLTRVLGSPEALSAAGGRAQGNAHVKLDARYGTWDPRQGVCPASGCPSPTAPSGSPPSGSG
ncbi:MAG TPA: hypothetical protein VGA62_01365 [Acidimicrobiia bacterium]